MPLWAALPPHMGQSSSRGAPVWMPQRLPAPSVPEKLEVMPSATAGVASGRCPGMVTFHAFLGHVRAAPNTHADSGGSTAQGRAAMLGSVPRPVPIRIRSRTRGHSKVAVENDVEQGPGVQIYAGVESGVGRWDEATHGEDLRIGGMRRRAPSMIAGKPS